MKIVTLMCLLDCYIFTCLVDRKFFFLQISLDNENNYGIPITITSNR